MDPVAENPPSPEQLNSDPSKSVIQSRLGLGGEALNPENNNIPKIDSVASLRSSFEQTHETTTNIIANASTVERTDYWNGKNIAGFDSQKREWINQMVAVCHEQKDITNILQTRNLGNINWENFNEAEADKLYQTYFSSQQNHLIEVRGRDGQVLTVPSNINQFVNDVMQSYTTNGHIDYEAFKQELPALKWIAKTFGDEHSFDIITNLIELKIKLQNDALAQELVNEVNIEEDIEVQGQTKKVTKLNNLAARAKQLFGFLHRHKDVKHVDKTVQSSTPLDQPPTEPSPPQQQPDIAGQTTPPIHQPPASEPQIPQPQPPITEPQIHQEEASQSAEQIADALLNYDTGIVSDHRIDIKGQLSKLVNRITQIAEEDSPLIPRNTQVVILSDIAQHMINKIAISANKKNLELGFVITGTYIEKNGRRIFVGALAVPSMDYSTAQPGVTRVDPVKFEANANLLAMKSNLAGLFLEKDQNPRGSVVANCHVHYENLGQGTWANPSRADLNSDVPQQMRTNNINYMQWGVATNAEGKLRLKLLGSEKDAMGYTNHNELLMLNENQLNVSNVINQMVNDLNQSLKEEIESPPSKELTSFTDLVTTVKDQLKPDEQTLTAQLDNNGLASIIPEVLAELKKNFGTAQLNLDTQNPPQAEIVNDQGTVRLRVNGTNLPAGLGDRVINLSFKLISGGTPNTLAFTEIQSDLPFYAKGRFADLLQKIKLHETLKRRTQEILGAEFEVNDLGLKLTNGKLAVDIKGKKK